MSNVPARECRALIASANASTPSVAVCSMIAIVLGARAVALSPAAAVATGTGAAVSSLVAVKKSMVVKGINSSFSPFSPSSRLPHH
jgi:hypothetical protein